MGDDRRLLRSKFALSYILSSAGVYLPAIEILESVEREKIPADLVPAYYACYDKAYSEMSYYGVGNAVIDYGKMAEAYKDSLLMVLPADAEVAMEVRETRLREARKLSEAMAVNNRRLDKAKGNTKLYAIIMFQRSLIFRRQNDKESEMKSLALSALADIRSGTKDHASLWSLAEILYDKGDIERAYRYMHISWEDTRTFNAPLRSWQSAKILSLIEERYNEIISERNANLRTFVTVVALSGVLLLLALLFIYKQYKRLRLSNDELGKAHGLLKETNEKLSRLNEELREVNCSLTDSNNALVESNRIKEVYFTHFIKLCSSYIDKLDKFRKTVNKKLSTGQVAELSQIVKNTYSLNDDIKEFYKNFDTAFLHIFPDFVDRFNSLLADDSQIELKSGELLNPELRVFALIRLGFNNSSQIAEFLRYSVNTIYNYRAKVKNKAKVNRDDFEELVRQIR